MMNDDGDCQMGFCMDLVTLSKTEAFPLSLLKNCQPGEWAPVKNVCQATGIAATEVKAELVATWLPDPFGNQDYAVIIFYDHETYESFAAHYNKRRLLETNTAAAP